MLIFLLGVLSLDRSVRVLPRAARRHLADPDDALERSPFTSFGLTPPCCLSRLLSICPLRRASGGPTTAGEGPAPKANSFHPFSLTVLR